MGAIGFLRRTCACVAAAALLVCGLPFAGASIAGVPEAQAASAKTNAWQIPDRFLYDASDPLKNTTYGGPKRWDVVAGGVINDDAAFLVTRTFEPTDTENVFIAHLSIDVNVTKAQNAADTPVFLCVAVDMSDIVQRSYEAVCSDFKTSDGSFSDEPPQEVKDADSMASYCEKCWIPELHDYLATGAVKASSGDYEVWGYGAATASYRVDFRDVPAYDLAEGRALSSYSKDGLTSNSRALVSHWATYWKDILERSTEKEYGVVLEHDTLAFYARVLLYDKFLWCTDGKGNPVEGATFTLDGDEHTGVEEKTATSDAQGRVSFTCLPAGDYTLELTSVPEGKHVDFEDTTFACSYTADPAAYTYSPFDETHVMLKDESAAYKNGIEKPKPAAKVPSTEELALNLGVKVKQSGKRIKVSWGKVKGAAGYDVYVQYCSKKFTSKSRVRVKGGSKTSVSVKKICGKKIDFNNNYKIVVKAYKKSGGKAKTLAKSITMHFVGSKASKYTNAKGIKLAKKSLALAVGKSAKVKGKVVLVNKKKKQLSKKHAATLRFESSNPNVAKVSKSGKVTGVKAGTCKVYVYAKNGYTKTVKVTVK